MFASLRFAHGSALDKNLADIVHKPIDQLLEKNPNIHTLIYTSEFVKKQVNKLFGTYHSIDKENSRKQSVKINGKVYQVRILYSPSGTALIGIGENGVEKRKKQYREFFTTSD